MMEVNPSAKTRATFLSDSPSSSSNTFFQWSIDDTILTSLEPGLRESPTMRLTVELIHNSLSYLNPLKERELDLRGAYFAMLKRTDATLWNEHD